MPLIEREAGTPPPGGSPDRIETLIRRAFDAGLLLLLAVGSPYVLLYRSEGARILGYSPRYFYGVLAPLAGVAALTVLTAASPAAARWLRAAFGRIPGSLAVPAGWAATAAALAYA